MDWAVTEKNYTQRKACARVGPEPKVYRYQPARPDDTGLRQRLRELASQRRRFGCRRLHLLAEREGVRLNGKKRYRPTGKKSSRFACAAGASGLWERGPRWLSQARPTSAGA